MPTYIELYFVCNFLVCFLNILLEKKIFKFKTRIIYIYVFCLIYVSIKFLLDYFETNLVLQLFVLFFVSLSGLIVVFKIRHIVQLVKVFAIHAILHSSCVGIQTMVATMTYHSVNYISNFYLLMLSAIAVVQFVLVTTIIEYFSITKDMLLSKECQLFVAGKEIEMTGFVDTGNKLVDPISKKSVVFVNMQVIKQHLSEQMYADIMLSTNSSGEFPTIHKIKYSTLSGTNFVTVFKPRRFLVSGRQIDCYVGICTNQMINGHDALLNVACI